MKLTFECAADGPVPRLWLGTIEILKTGDPCEAEVCALGYSFHVIVGSHEYGNYLCIPNWNIGSELGRMADSFWNEERLMDYAGLREMEARTIATALSIMERYTG